MVNEEIIDGFMFGIAEPHELYEVRRVHHDEYFRRGYISKKYPDGVITDMFLHISVFFAAKEIATGKIVGVMRMINTGSPFGLPTLNEFEILPKAQARIARIYPSNIVDVGSLAEIKGYRVAEGLYRRALVNSSMRKIKYWLASIDTRVLRAFRIRGIEWQDIGETKDYMGSPTTPVILKLEDLYKVRLRAPRLHRYLFGPTPDKLF